MIFEIIKYSSNYFNIIFFIKYLLFKFFFSLYILVFNLIIINNIYEYL